MHYELIRGAGREGLNTAVRDESDLGTYLRMDTHALMLLYDLLFRHDTSHMM